MQLSNHFLIAMPSLEDPNFSRTVTLICEHSESGAMGITINRPMDLALGDVLTQMGIEFEPSAQTESPIYQGGPVQENRGFVLHEPIGHWESTLMVTESLGVSTSRDILNAIAKQDGPTHHILTLGYAGWGPGQLEQEIADNAWLNGPANREIIFEVATDQRWRAAAEQLGVDLAALSGETGHA